MATGKPETSKPEDSGAQLQALHKKVTLLTANFQRVMDQTVATSQAIFDRVQRGEARLAILEASRVVHSLTRASHFYPKTRTVVFVGRGAFADNVKYAYLSFCAAAKEKNIRCLFLPFDAAHHEMLAAVGLPSLSPQVAKWSREDAQALLGASAVVLCDNFHPHSTLSPVHYGLLQGARSVQLWHGIPLKEIGLQHIFAPGGQNIVLSDILGSSGFFDVLVGPASAAEQEWRRAFAFRDYAAIGNPRNDIFYREPTPYDLLGVDQETLRAVQDARRQNRAVIVYAPTFRDHTGVDWFERSGIIPVIAKYRDQAHEFIINLHPFEHNAVGELRSRYPALTFVEPNTDFYPVVKHASIFITDYSSLAFDVLHIDCPQVFFRPDHEEYMAKARALVPGREGYTPGETVIDLASLARAIDAALEAVRHPDKDVFRNARHDLRKKLFDHHDGKAGLRLNDVIAQQVDAVMREQEASGRQVS